MRPTRLVRLAAAVLVTAAAGLVGVAYAAPPASAGTCSSSTGVTVLVDFQQLGGGVQGSCVADGAGQRASSLFPEAGFPIAYVQSEPGFVCRVAGVPSAADEGCVDTPPDTAYWGLWWSDGTTGTWSYSNYGVGSLKVPDGGYVAFSWKQGPGSAPAPGVAPAAHAATATPTAVASSASAPTATPKPKPKPKHSATPTPGPQATSRPSTRPSTGPTPTPTSSPTPTPVPTPSAPSRTPTAAASGSAPASPASGPTSSPAVPSAVPSTSTSTSASASTSGAVVSDPRPARTSAAGSGGGLPAWLVVLVVAALFAAAGILAVVRRRRGGASR